MASKRDRTTDSLLHPGRGHTPSYGINEESQEEKNGSSLSVSHSNERVWPVAVFSLIACIGSVLIGFFLGYSTNTLSEFSDLYHSGEHTYGIKNGTPPASWFGAIGPLGALFGGPVAWPISDSFGRKPALMLGSIPTLIGWLAFAYSNLLPTRAGFLTLLYIGRFLTGFGSGWTILCVSVYIAEISTSKLRGLFGNCNQLFITVGIFLVEALGSHPKSFLKFNDVALIAAALVAIFAISLLFIKETPRWLYKKNKDLQGNLTLNFLRGPKADVPKEIRGIKNAINDTAGFTLWDQLKALKHRAVFLPFLLILMLMFFQQFSGINAAIFYSTQIFMGAGVSSHTAPLVSLLAVGLVQIFATLVSVVLVDLLGRKILLVVSSSGMLLSSTGLGIYFLIYDHYCHKTLDDSSSDLAACQSNSFGGLAIACIVLFIISFSLGWGPIPWSMMSELLPLQIRDLAGAIATFVNWTFAFVITLSFNKYAVAVTPKFAWWSFGFIMLISIFCVLFLLPETKGRKLEEIEEHFKEGKILYNPCKRERRR